MTYLLLLKKWLLFILVGLFIYLSATQLSHADSVSIDYLRGEGDVQGLKLAYRIDSDYLADVYPSLLLTFESSINVWEYGDPERYDSNFILSFSPVIKHQFYESTNGYVFGEFGIGISLLDDTRFAGKDVSTHFQFEDRLGLGYAFGKERQHSVSLRYFHYSNAGIKSPNPGYDYISLSFSTKL